MGNFIKNQEEKLQKVISDCGYSVESVTIVPSARPDLGQFQYNGVMGLAKENRTNPRNIAEAIVEKLKDDPDYADINVAGPGFINFTFSDELLTEYIDSIREDADKNINIHPKKKVVMDYGGPNVAKVLHVGHLRSANIGEALKRLAKKLGYEIIGDVHLGDWGRPMGLVMLELKQRYPDWAYFDENYEGEYPDDCPITNEDLEKIYPLASTKAKEDPAYLEEAKEITTKLQQKQRGYYALWKKIVQISTNEIKKLYDTLNVSFDLWKGESDADDYMEDVINYLKDKQLVHESQGALIMDVSNPDDTFEVPPVLVVKSNGSVSYQTTDIATIWQRMEDYNPDEIWYVADKRQSLHFEQVFRAVRKSGIVKEDTVLSHVGFGTVNGKDGKPFKTRDGGVMTLEGLINLVQGETLKKVNPNLSEEEKKKIADIVGTGTLKYADLLPNVTTDYIFDPEKFSDFNGKTGVYLLYSVVRMKSLLKKAKEQNITVGPIRKIVGESDRNIALKLLEEPAVLDKALADKSLNEIAEYLFQLANLYNNFYTANKVLSEEDEEVRKSWLGLTECVYNVCSSLLDILGIEQPEKM